MVKLLLHFISIEVLEEVSLLPLVITHVKGVTCYIMLLSIEIFPCRHRIVIRARLHGSLVARHPVAEATLMLDLAR